VDAPSFPAPRLEEHGRTPPKFGRERDGEKRKKEESSTRMWGAFTSLCKVINNNKTPAKLPLSYKGNLRSAVSYVEALFPRQGRISSLHIIASV